MRRWNKKATLSISIGAIVVIVIAFVVLGLGLTLTKTIFGGAKEKIPEIFAITKLGQEPTSEIPLTVPDAIDINRNSEIIPIETITKEPSAELRPDQQDLDTLPPYEILDEILSYYVDEGNSIQDILQFYDHPDEVKWVINAVNKNEYKRRQAAPGLKVTPKAFGVGRRMPIAAKYEEGDI